jgi:protease-4
MLGVACSPHIHLDVLGEPGLKEIVLLKSKQKHKVLLIGLSGTIQTSRDPGFGRRRGDSVTRIHARLKMAAMDPNIKGVILKLDPPGGEGTASDIIYHEVLTFKEKTGLPVVALMMGMATSGGYYVAAACDYIIAHPTTITGSIGVIGILPNFKEGLDKIGVKIEVIKSGAMKDAGSPFRGMTSQERNYFQKQVDAFHKKFVSVVHDNRKPHLSLTEIEKIADGRAYGAAEALDLKLIDQIGYFDDALKKILTLAELKDAKVVSYTHFPRSTPSLYAVDGGDANPLKISVEGLSEFLPSLRTGIYYLWLPDFYD